MKASGEIFLEPITFELETGGVAAAEAQRPPRAAPQLEPLLAPYNFFNWGLFKNVL